VQKVSHLGRRGARALRIDIGVLSRTFSQQKFFLVDGGGGQNHCRSELATVAQTNTKIREIDDRDFANL
jgi:hypothetical protein